MSTPQPGIFHEGHDHSYFLEFALREPLERDALCDGLRELGAQTAVSGDPEVVLAFGRRALALLAPDDVPAELEDFKTIEGAAGLSAPSTQRDVLVWIKGTRHDLCFERALEAGRAMAPLAEPSLDLSGFTYKDSRDLIGFVDGTANPKGEDREAAAVVEAGPGAGGSFVLSQQYVHDMAKWNAVPVAVQEKIVGRTKVDDVELEGDDMPPDSHVSRTDVKVDGEAMKIWRRSSPYGNVREHGLYFLAFAKHPQRFQVQLDRMFGIAGDDHHDRLMEFSHAVTGSYWFAPPVETLRKALA